VSFTNGEDFCDSYILVPGMTILPNALLVIIYGIFLLYIFVGLFVISDVMHAGIEKITSARKTTYETNDGVRTKFMTPTWNRTIANLTLMAFGSSAPEIFLNLIETIKTLDSGKASELGMATIIGSAAFNLMIVTGISIAAVSEEADTREQDELDYDQTPRGVKKIKDSGVFATTAIFSLLGYAWVWYCFSGDKASGGVTITVTESIITFGLFFVLLGVAYCADRVHNKKQQRRD